MTQRAGWSRTARLRRDGCPRIRTIDVHTAGEPLRVIVEGYPDLPGATMLDRRRHAREELDHLRRALMWEPRGHADMYGCVLTPPATADGHLGVVFLHNEGYSTMCGHGIIGLVKVALEAGWLDVEGSRPEVRIDTPAGRVTATAEMEAGRVREVSFVNVPSFVLARDRVVEVPGLGPVRCDVAFGGAFYAYVDARDVGLVLDPERYRRIVETAMAIRHAVAADIDVVHPSGHADLGFLYGTILVEPAALPLHSRNVCVFADREVDRSPTGTGVSGRAAIHHARGELEIGAWWTIESLIGTRFDVRVVDTTTVAGRPAVVPEVRGSAHIVGESEFWLDPEDPLCHGFLLR